MGSTSFEDFIRPYRESESPAARLVRTAAERAFVAERAERDAVGVALASARKESGATQQAVADMAGIQQAELSRIENGLANPTMDTLLKVLAALDLRLAFEPASSVDTALGLSRHRARTLLSAAHGGDGRVGDRQQDDFHEGLP